MFAGEAVDKNGNVLGETRADTRQACCNALFAAHQNAHIVLTWLASRESALLLMHDRINWESQRAA